MGQVKAYLAYYSPDEAVSIVLKHDSDVSKAAEKYNVKKEMIQGILVRELMCFNPAQDPVADMAVQYYYHNQHEKEYYMTLKWWQQILYGSPEFFYPEREDCSTGIGQIFAKTAINATNYLKETKIDYSNWKQRKKVWYKLKDNDAYSAQMVAKVLSYKSKGKNISKPNKTEFESAAALYNASTVKKGLNYGKKIYQYNKYFAKYNAAN